MAKWGWGRGAEDFRVDHKDVMGTTIYVGDTPLIDHIDYVDEEAGEYRVLVTDPPGQPAGPDRKAGDPATRWKFDHDKCDIVREMRKALGKLRVQPPDALEDGTLPTLLPPTPRQEIHGEL
jgi:hypothetical protein